MFQVWYGKAWPEFVGKRFSALSSQYDVDHYIVIDKLLNSAVTNFGNSDMHVNTLLSR
jgi:hypothetical protein